jgi:hypothetical protein
MDAAFSPFFTPSVFRGKKGCAKAKTKQAIAKHRAASTKRFRNLRRADLTQESNIGKIDRFEPSEIEKVNDYRYGKRSERKHESGK